MLTKNAHFWKSLNEVINMTTGWWETGVPFHDVNRARGLFPDSELTEIIEFLNEIYQYAGEQLQIQNFEWRDQYPLLEDGALQKINSFISYQMR